MAKFFAMLRNVFAYAFMRNNMKHDMMVEAALISRPWETM